MVFNPLSGETHFVSSIVASILVAMKAGRHSIADLSRSLEHAGFTEAEVSAALESALEQLEEAGLVCRMLPSENR